MKKERKKERKKVKGSRWCTTLHLQWRTSIGSKVNSWSALLLDHCFKPSLVLSMSECELFGDREDSLIFLLQQCNNPSNRNYNYLKQICHPIIAKIETTFFGHVNQKTEPRICKCFWEAVVLELGSQQGYILWITILLTL